MTRCPPSWATVRVMARRWPGAAVLGAAALALTACSAPAPRTAPVANTASARTTTHEIHVNVRNRSYVQISPLRPASGRIPIIVMLSGIHAPVGTEMGRDGLLGLAATGRAELIYPVGVNKSWNAIGCCGTANREHVDDVAFLHALLPRVDPGRTRPIYLAGYSNGGRLVYRILCTDPGLFTGYEVIKAMPEPGCVVTKPVSILQIDSTDDRGVPYKPGDHGRESPPATTEMARLRRVGHCQASGNAGTGGQVRVTTWTGCRQGTRITFAVYQGGGHSWPDGGGGTASAATLMSTFAGATPPGEPASGQPTPSASTDQHGVTSAGHQGSGPAASK